MTVEVHSLIDLISWSVVRFENVDLVNFVYSDALVFHQYFDWKHIVANFAHHESDIDWTFIMRELDRIR